MRIVATIITSLVLAVPSGVVFAAATTTPTALTPKMQAAITRADQEIDRRTKALNDLNIRVQAMQKVSDSFKQGLSANIQAQVTGLQQLKAKIDAGTDLETLKTDIQSITKSYRIYMLVMPQSRIAAAADRLVAITTMMNVMGTKLQARIQAAQNQGKDVSALLAALTDLGDKLTDASTQAQAAASVSAGLTPDNGDATQMAANTNALKTAQKDLQTAQKDLVAARKDIQIIVSGLKSLESTATATSTTP